MILAREVTEAPSSMEVNWLDPDLERVEVAATTEGVVDMQVEEAEVPVTPITPSLRLPTAFGQAMDTPG